LVLFCSLASADSNGAYFFIPDDVLAEILSKTAKKKSIFLEIEKEGQNFFILSRSTV